MQTHFTEPDTYANEIKTIRVLFPKEFPAVSANCTKFPPTLVPTRNCEFPGMWAEILKILADYMNATIEIHTMYDPENSTDKLYIGKIGKNQIDGLMGYVYSGIVDTICYPLQKTIIRSKVFDFSNEIYSVTADIYHRRYDDQIYDKWSFFKIYDNCSWSIIGITLFLQGFFYVANEYFECMNSRINFTKISDALWQAVQLHLRQAVSNSKWKTLAVKFNILMISLFQAVIIMGIYSSYILGQKLTVTSIATIRGPKQLIGVVESGERYFVSTTASDWFYEALNRSDAYPFKALRKSVKSNPIYITENEEENLQLASSGGGLVMIMEDHISNIVAKNYCNLVPMDEPIAQVSSHLIFKKYSPLVEPINDAIFKNKIPILKIFRKYMELIRRVNNPLCNKLTARIDLPFVGVFITWIGLIGVSMSILAVELLFWRFYHKPRKSVTI